MPKLKRGTRVISSATSAVNFAFDVARPTTSSASTRLSRDEDCIVVRESFSLSHANQSSADLNVTASALSNQEMKLMKMKIEAQNQADIVSVMYIANYHRQNDRPRNTKINYGLKQRAWKKWCSERKFKDLDTVTDGKLLLWLNQVVISQKNRSTSSKRESKLTKSELKSYVKPIIDLYEVIHILNFVFLLI